MITVLHAYSERNRGDAFLVAAAIDRIRRAVPGASLRIVALDDSSFAEHGTVIGWGTTRSAAGVETARAAVRSGWALASSRWRAGVLDDLVAGSDAVVAVGGGYLSAGPRRARLGVLINHLPQLEAAARGDAPSIYLPQSIGPLRGRVGERARRALARIDRVWVRDPESSQEVAGAGVAPCPDLAVLEIAEVGPPEPTPDGSVVGIARRLEAPAGYRDRLTALDELLPGIDWGIQAEGGPEKGDRQFYDELGWAHRPVEQLVADRVPVVVSVRLHGSLLAVRDGFSTVHLAYEPKGFAAMADLGLREWVHDARRFDPQLVADQAAELVRDPQRYRRALAAARPDLVAASGRLDEDLRRRIG